MLASQLAGISMMGRALASKLDMGEDVTADEFQRVVELIDEAGEQARTLSHSLMPLEVHNDELAGGLQKLVQRHEEMTDIPCSFEADDAVPPLRGEMAAHFYRIAAEAINNAAKHARPDAISIRLQVEGDRLVLRVEDDGVGIPETPDPTNGIGLHMMQYRAELMGARLEVRPTEEGGTLVLCSVPLASIPQEPDPSAKP
jgi:signal transduction histidine kinase